MMPISMILIQAAEAMEAAPELSAGALAFMLVSMGAVATLTFWCFARILRTKDHFDPDGTGPARPPVAGEKEKRPGA